jgi:Putative Ig domain.
MACELAEALVEGVDFDVDLLNGRIMFLSTGALGPTVEDFFDSGGCAVQVDLDCANGQICAPAPCPPCTDDPILNISAEDADSDRFVFNIDVLGNPQLNELFEQLGCFAWCWSDISQEDADLCAIRQAIQCANDAIQQPVLGTGGFQVPGGRVPPLIFNTVQTCEFTCPDGSTFGWTFPPNQVAARTLSEANRIAHSFACRYARLRRICIVSTPVPACIGEPYIGILEASGGIPFTTSQGQCPYLWQLINGTIPPGLSLNQCTGQVTGTPTTGGTFNFLVRATDSIGSYQQKVITVGVEEITTTSTLPDANLEAAYDEQLLAIPSESANELWSVVSGALPDGLSLGSDGRITGTPSMDSAGQEFEFRAKVEFIVSGQTGSCEKDFTINVTSTLLIDLLFSNPLDSCGASAWPTAFQAPFFTSSSGWLTAIACSQLVPAKLDNGYNSVLPTSPGIIPDNTNTFMGFSTDDGFSFAWWMKINAIAITDDIFFRQGANRGYIFRLDAAGFLTFFHGTGAAFDSVTAVDAMPVGTWCHVVATYEKTVGMTIRVSTDSTFGTKSTTVPTGFSAAVAATTVSFGANQAGSDFVFDELDCWTRPLTDDEAEEHWNTGSGITYPFSN